MDREIDSKDREMLLEALGKIIEFSKELRRKRDDRLYKAITVPCSLSDVIHKLGTYELDMIRKNLELRDLSALKKIDLAGELIKLIPCKARNIFILFDKERYNIAKRICAKDGFIYNNIIELSKVQYFMTHGLIFPGNNDGKKILAMPPEIIEIFKEIDGPEYVKVIKRNTEWIQLTHGMLYYYGVLDINRLQNMIEKLTGEKPDFAQYLKVINGAVLYHGQIKSDIYGFCDRRVFPVDEIIQEQTARPDVDYYPFDKEQLLMAAKPGYIDRTTHLESFVEGSRS